MGEGCADRPADSSIRLGGADFIVVAEVSERSPIRLTMRAFVVAVLLFTAGTAFAEERVLDLAIHAGAPAAKPQLLSVLQNDRVVVRLTSDKPVEVHLHGYDIETEVAPGRVTSMRFTATATGRFPIEIHSHDARRQGPLAYLEVQPR